jgi:hypothetical protein
MGICLGLSYPALEEVVGAGLFIWLGRCSSLVVFACGSSEVAPPPLPPLFQNILGSIFLFVVAMIFWAMVEIIGTYLRGLDVLAQGPLDPKIVDRFAQSIFKTFGMASKQISNIGKTTIKPQRTSKTSTKHSTK